MEVIKEFFTSPQVLYTIVLIVLVALVFLFDKKVKELYSNNTVKTILFVTFLAVVFIFITFNWLIELSSFAVGIGKGALGLFLVWVFDKYGMKEIDTIKELEKGNIAYAIFFLGLCLIVAAAILNS